MHWNRYRKLSIQVLVISSLHGIPIFPFLLINFLYICAVEYDVNNDFFVLASYFPYYVLLLFPVAAGSSLPELRQRMKSSMRFGRRAATIHPSAWSYKDDSTHLFFSGLYDVYECKREHSRSSVVPLAKLRFDLLHKDTVRLLARMISY